MPISTWLPTQESDVYPEYTMLTNRAQPPQVALSFLRTLSTIPTTQHERKTSIYSQPPQKFDRLGRRISTTQRPSRGSGSSSEAPSPPPMLRAHSSMTSPDLPETEESKRISRELRHLRRQSDGVCSRCCSIILKIADGSYHSKTRNSGARRRY